MNKKLYSGLATIGVLLTILGTQAYAARSTIYLPTNQVWVYRNATRSGNYSYISTACHSVYPVSGTDTFTRIQVQMTNTNGTNIAVGTPTVITEGQGTYSYYIRENYLNTTTVRFGFRGNSSEAAYTDVTYLPH